MAELYEYFTMAHLHLTTKNIPIKISGMTSQSLAYWRYDGLLNTTFKSRNFPPVFSYSLDVESIFVIKIIRFICTLMRSSKALHISLLAVFNLGRVFASFMWNILF